MRTDEDFDRLLLALDMVELLATGKFATLEQRFLHAEELTQLLRDQIKTKPAMQWMQLLRGSTTFRSSSSQNSVNLTTTHIWS